MTKTTRNWVIGLISAVALTACGACSLGGALRSAGVDPGPAVNEACSATIEVEDARAVAVLDRGDRVACEIFAGVAQYEGFQAFVEDLGEQAVASEDESFKAGVLKLIAFEESLRPGARLLNRTLDAWVYLDAEIEEYREANKDPTALLVKAADTYGELLEIWRDFEPVLNEARASAGLN